MADTAAERRVRSWVALVGGDASGDGGASGGPGRRCGGGAGDASVDLDVEKTVRPGTVHVGELQTFTIKIINDGSTRAERVRMRDPLPFKVRFVRASTSREVPGSCGIEDWVVTCGLGTLRADRTVTVKIHVKPVVAGSYTNRAYVSFTEPGARGRDLTNLSDAAGAVVEPAGQ